MPPGTVCRYESEQAYMNQFIFTWSYSKHRIRALWIKHLGLKIVNNIGQVPTCEEHFNYKICLADSIIFDRVKAWPNDLDNIIKGRKKRDSNNCKPIILGELIQEMLQLAAGAMCAGRTCYTTLWLNTGPLEADDNNLRYCSPTCHRRRRRRGKDHHSNKLHIIQQCLEEKLNLLHANIYQEPKLGGVSLIKQLQTYANNGYKSKIKTTTPGKIFEEPVNSPHGTCKEQAMCILQKLFSPCRNMLCYAYRNDVLTKIMSIHFNTNYIAFT